MEAVNQSREAISGCRSCKDQGLGFRVQGLGFRVHHIRFFVDCFLKFCFLCCCSIIVFLFLFLWTGWSVQWTSAECNDLWLVDPQCNYKGEEAQVMAANAASRSKLEQVHVSESLSAALKGCSMVSKGVIDCRFSFISPPADLHPNSVFFFFFFGFLFF
jgi:hypothetical protein